MVTLADLQWKIHERTKMCLSSSRHVNLYKSEKIPHVYEEIHEGLEIKSIDRGFTWQFAW
jgi:hypothetical protein